MGRFKSTLDTVEYMRRLCQLGGHPIPAWLNAWEKCVLGANSSPLRSLCLHLGWFLMSYYYLYRRLDALQLPGTEKITHKKGERVARVKPIHFPEDNLVDSFYARNADVSFIPSISCRSRLLLSSAALQCVAQQAPGVVQAKQYPVQINSFQPHPARVFAWRQMQLMQKGMSKGAARRKVQEQFEKEYASR